MASTTVITNTHVTIDDRSDRCLVKISISIECYYSVYQKKTDPYYQHEDTERHLSVDFVNLNFPKEETMTKWSEKFHELADSLDMRDKRERVTRELAMTVGALLHAEEQGAGHPCKVKVLTNIPGLEVHYTSPECKGASDVCQLEYGAPECGDMPNPLAFWAKGRVNTLLRKVKAFRDA